MAGSIQIPILGVFLLAASLTATDVGGTTSGRFTATYTRADTVTSETLAQCRLNVDLTNTGETVEYAYLHLTASDDPEPASPGMGPLSLQRDAVVQLSEIITVPLAELNRWKDGDAGPRLRVEYLGAEGAMVVEYVELVSAETSGGEDE